MAGRRKEQPRVTSFEFSQPGRQTVAAAPWLAKGSFVCRRESDLETFCLFFLVVAVKGWKNIIITG